MFEEENQMGLFEIAGDPPDRMFREPALPPPPSTKPASLSAKPATASSAKPASALKSVNAPPARPASKASAKPAGRKGTRPVATNTPTAKAVSGLVPDGDVRLTANIRQDLHLKLKIASAHRRTTIGEILEELIENHIR